jgi:TolB-like protein/DNA-binding winged helix-turn-helix (wHTH) protein/tetratricopeptide (TPR) repeat protein
LNHAADCTRYQVLDLDVDLARRRVLRAGTALELPDLSFRLLAALIREAPDTVGKDELIETVWQGVVVSDETLSQRIRLLRQALGEEGAEPRYLSSVRGRGYRMICPVTPAPAPASGRSGHWLYWAGLCLALIFVGLGWRWESPAPATGIRSVAVLPFADLSPSGDYRYFADGMQEELLARLARIDRLQVASRTSVEQFRGTRDPVPEIARRLDVDAVIESSVRVAGDRVRVTIQLIDADSDRHLWAESYDRELSVASIFGIQQELAIRIGEVLARRIQQPGSGGLPTDSLPAYDAYLVGRYHTFRQTPEDLEIATKRLQEAVAIDPEFAEAWTTLGWAWSFAGTIYGRQPPQEVYPKARDAVIRALAIDHRLANAHNLYADILTWYDWDFAAAEREYLKTVEYDPSQVLGYALLLSVQGRHEEAIALIEQRLEASPRDPWTHVNAAWLFLRAGDYDRAMQEAVLAENHSDAASVKAYVYGSRGQLERAEAVLTQEIRGRGREPRYLSQLAIVLFQLGKEAEGRKLLDELEAEAQRAYLSPDLLADVYLTAGEVDQGFTLYERAIEDRARGAIFIRGNPAFDELREEPRYLALVEAVGF